MKVLRSSDQTVSCLCLFAASYEQIVCLQREIQGSISALCAVFLLTSLPHTAVLSSDVLENFVN